MIRNLLIWRRFSRTIRGTLVEGDTSVPRTHWWNLPFLVLFFWKKVAVFEVKNPAYVYIGFSDFQGETFISMGSIYAERFGMMIGREDCTFFAIDPLGGEVPLKLLEVTRKGVPKYRDLPLY